MVPCALTGSTNAGRWHGSAARAAGDGEGAGGREWAISRAITHPGRPHRPPPRRHGGRVGDDLARAGRAAEETALGPRGGARAGPRPRRPAAARPGEVLVRGHRARRGRLAVGAELGRGARRGAGRAGLRSGPAARPRQGERMTTALDGIVQATHAEPGEETNWLVLADWLEEHDRREQAELLRLHRGLRKLREGPERHAREAAVRGLILSGTRPFVPSRTSPVGLELALVPAGAFRLGSPVREYHRMDDEPLHKVTIPQALYMGAHPVTQAQYAAVRGTNPSHFKRSRKGCRRLPVERFPVESVSWHDAEAFCRQLTRRERATLGDWEYRLPTEAEWEYACRAWFSSRSAFWFGPRLTSQLANFRGRFPFPPEEDDPAGVSPERPTEVGLYPPNPFGLYDMHGNVDEWVADWFEEGYYEESPRDDPIGPDEG